MVLFDEIVEQILRKEEVKKLLKKFQVEHDLDVIVQTENSPGLGRYRFAEEKVDLLQLEQLRMLCVVRQSE